MSDELSIQATNPSEPQASFDDPWKEGLELYLALLNKGMILNLKPKVSGSKSSIKSATPFILSHS